MFAIRGTLVLGQEEKYAARLVHSPEKWNMELAEIAPTDTPIAKDSAEAKSMLLTFLSNNKLPSYRSLSHFVYSLMLVCAFSLIGLIREIQFKRKQRKSEPGGAANPLSPSAQGPAGR